MSPRLPAPVELARTVHVEHCMGTVFSVDVRDPGSWGGAVGEEIGRASCRERVYVLV